MPVSTNDTTILAMLSRYPDIPDEEADEYITGIEHEENVPICHAVIGRIPPEQLDPEARQVYQEFRRWSLDRTRRFRNEQVSARRRQQETRTTIRMTQLHERGVISRETMLLYGISGDLPDREVYMALTPEEKEALWEDRIERRFGPNWRVTFRTLGPISFSGTQMIRPVHDWRQEGF